MKLDPRTKLFLAIVANCVILSAPPVYSALMFAVPAVLLLFEKKWRFVLAFFSVYLASAIGFEYLKTMDVGMAGTLVVSTMMIVSHMMPITIVLYYVMMSTKVNEFMAGMSRMHMPNKITIPLAVMIRFFPTVFDEARDIGNAMHMRGIRLFSLRTMKNPLTILEYRLIPLLVSLTKIGDELSVAATTRGLSPETRRSCVTTIGFHVQDVIVFVYCVAVVVCLLCDVNPLSVILEEGP
ncbi:MAG: energy-coupling factor transporter transmembrane protein EcfT [Fibrobacter sp.]|uniref:energy-coupling factor transporter transmembrane component T n=1 Tax=Fibrobacter sp. TaxID=35828 RepID=UPI0025C42BA3|nr:energy-coupling factor transporter transmembrane component T [Fibrobacter sp.]MBQ3721765.1 energy-coupling factor transporter transmembrane protein EcfT [Fibrobacter sp.]MBQ7080346.1 energy-coupling factor transporter transmembrane protein EcfT [Fibrobacter sp.]